MIAALEHDTAGCRRVALYRHASPWPWLPSGHPDLVGARQETVVSSTLRNVNPTIEIFQRRQQTFSVPMSCRPSVLRDTADLKIRTTPKRKSSTSA
jgi:hypothetical protein